MADPVTILCSILTIADSSKKILDVCTKYVAHAKNAPKEFQTVIEDVHALNGAMKRLDSLARTAQRTERTTDQFNQWEVPLTRIKKHSEDLVQLISQQDTRIGWLHEFQFRARWQQHWQTADNLLQEIRREKGELQLVTTVHGAEMVGMVFELVNERLPRKLPAGLPNSEHRSVILWEKVDRKYCSLEQRHAFILERLGDLIGWSRAR